MTNWQVGIVFPLAVLIAVVVARFIAYALWSRFTAMGRFESRIYEQVEDSLRETEQAEMYDRLEQRLRGRKHVLGLSGRRRTSK